MPRLNNAEALTRLKADLQKNFQAQKGQEIIITIGMGTCGLAAGAGETAQAILEELKKHNINAIVRSVGCIGMCVKEPLVDIQCVGQPRISYANVMPSHIPRLVEEHILNGQIVYEWAIGYVPSNW